MNTLFHKIMTGASDMVRPDPLQPVKKALLIGINYKNSADRYQLNGCINDVRNMRNILIRHYDYSPDNIIMLTDETKVKPTRRNILRFLKQLVSGGNIDTPHVLYFHFSGHGTMRLDNDGDEADDRIDECLVPMDFDKHGIIRDDEVHDIITEATPNNRLFIVVDACHSGSMFDLRYQLDCESQLCINDKIEEGKYDASQWNNKYTITENTNYDRPKALMFTLSGCRDNQKAGDTKIGSMYQGVLSYYLTEILQKYKYQPIEIKQLMKDLHGRLTMGQYKQRPILQSSHSIDIEHKISL